MAEHHDFILISGGGKISYPAFVSNLIAIVGRPNAGRSALFNRIVGKRIAIVHDQPGVIWRRLELRKPIGQFQTNPPGFHPAEAGHGAGCRINA